MKQKPKPEVKLEVVDEKTITEDVKPYFYDFTDKRDPFIPFIAMQSAVKPSGEKVPLTPLQEYDFDQLKLVAVMIMGENKKAIIEDYQGKGYIVNIDTYVGKNFGKVKDIMPDKIIIEEKYKDYMGKIQNKNIPMELYAPGEEERS